MDKEKTIDVIAIADCVSSVDRSVLRQIASFLGEFDHPVKLISIRGCKDIWIRDFMPIIRHDGKFVKYRYAPEYLTSQKRRRQYITNFDEIKVQEIYPSTSQAASFNRYFGLNDDDFVETDLSIDGGNFVVCVDKNGRNCALMTVKVLYDNPTKSQAAVISELERVFDAEVILLPWDTEDEFGHTDGMVMPVSPGHLILNNYKECDQKFYHQIELALRNRFKLDTLEYGENNTALSWCHLNYLELENIVLVPGCSLISDNIARRLIQEYLHKETRDFQMRKIVKEGGALHCITWNYKLKLS